MKRYKIETNKWSFGSTSESIIPKFTPTFYTVEVPIIKKDKKKGNWLVGISFSCKEDAEVFKDFLEEYLPKLIKQEKRK